MKHAHHTPRGAQEQHPLDRQKKTLRGRKGAIKFLYHVVHRGKRLIFAADKGMVHFPHLPAPPYGEPHFSIHWKSLRRFFGWGKMTKVDFLVALYRMNIEVRLTHGGHHDRELRTIEENARLLAKTIL